jgi:hypothetical protein
MEHSEYDIELDRDFNSALVMDSLDTNTRKKRLNELAAEFDTTGRSVRAVLKVTISKD